VIGFDVQGKPFNQEKVLSVEKWLDNTSKVLTFIDVGGHKKAQKQVVSSFCSYFPEYAVWVVSGINKTPINPDTLELVNTFGLPLIVVITHLDKMDKDM
jgi:GTPase